MDENSESENSQFEDEEEYDEESELDCKSVLSETNDHDMCESNINQIQDDLIISNKDNNQLKKYKIMKFYNGNEEPNSRILTSPQEFQKGKE